MKSNYIRIFLLSVIVVMFISLSTRWHEMFDTTPQNTSQQSSQTVAQSGAATAPTATRSSNASQVVTANVGLDANQHTIATIDTGVFNNVQISQLNGALISASLKDYNVSLQDQSPLPILANDPHNVYIAESVLVINNQSVNINYSLESNVKQGDNIIVTLKGDADGVEVTKVYTFNQQTYAISLKQSVINNSGKALNISFDNFVLRHFDADNHKFSIFDAHSYAFNGVALSSTQNNYQKESFKDLGSSNQAVKVSTTQGWAAIVQHYFVTAWVPESNGQPFTVYAKPLDNTTFQAGFITNPVSLAEGQTLQHSSQVYTGPIIKTYLEAVAPHLDLTLDYGLLSFISVIIFWLMNLIHTFVGNWGLAIILVTVVIKLIFWPLSAKSYRSMAKMRLLQPRMKKLQELYKDDRQKLGKKMMEMYREEKVNPASGCLPILVQIPVFIALYWVLLESVQLRQAPFIFWIHDLAVKDPYFILPILMGISMFVQQRISPAPADKMQARIMMAMPVIFTIFFASFPAGLVLYWLTNNLISISQQYYITRKFAKDYAKSRR